MLTVLELQLEVEDLMLSELQQVEGLMQPQLQQVGHLIVVPTKIIN